jgi:Cd2+/Zn2+-exporting ATPase
MVSGGVEIFVKGLNEVRHRSPGMNFLMTVAAIGACLIGEWEEASLVVILFSGALFLERVSVERSHREIRKLMEVASPYASVRRGRVEFLISVEDVDVGERIIVRPGERVPLDGIVADGVSEINESSLTGESAPVIKKTGDEVYAGTLNGAGTLEVNVIRRSGDSTIAQITRLVEEALSRRAPVQQFVDRFARFYTPSVLILAVLVAAVPPIVFGAPTMEWLYRSLVMLVIACPCALVISTPVTIISGITNAARHGILIKGGTHLENIGKIKTVVFDKTGTITGGRPCVTEVVPLNSVTGREILRLAATLEEKSEHHLAGAIVRRAEIGRASCRERVLAMV